jgi:hypothetical protein
MTHSIILDNTTRNDAMRAFYATPDAIPDTDRPADPRLRLPQRWHYVGRVISAIWDSYDPSEDMANGESRRDTVLRHVTDELTGFETFDHLYTANFAYDLETALRNLVVETVIMEMVVPEEQQHGRQADTLAAAIPRARPVTLHGSDRRLVSTDAAKFSLAIRAALTTPFG